VSQKIIGLKQGAFARQSELKTERGILAGDAVIELGHAEGVL
jgi:hypothetical protein